MEEEPAKPWPKCLSNSELIQELEEVDHNGSGMAMEALVLEAQRRQALDFLRHHTDTEPQ